MRRFITPREALAWAFAGVCVIVLVGAILVSLAAQASTTQRITDEGKARRDQTCRLFERQELTEVQRVIRTYDYLDHLPRSERGSTLTVAIVGGLKAQREDAEAAVAPSYCNEAKGQPVVGLPETPKYQLSLPPKRDFSRLLSK